MYYSGHRLNSGAKAMIPKCPLKIYLVPVKIYFSLVMVHFCRFIEGAYIYSFSINMV